ncbi:MAG: GGDEF domain-containing protein [Pirellulaceae bacterium]|nr:GGDEF domain-containing protein [Pirellulaceae bacterium]
MSQPAHILLATDSRERSESWTAALATVRCRVHRPDDPQAAADVDVIVTDRPLSQSNLPLDDERLARGEIGLVTVGVAGPADVSLPGDCSSREVRLACLLLAEIIRLRRQREAARRRERVLSHLALSDPLTGLPNRRAWEQQLAERLLGEGEATPCCLALFDIDLFKELNDRAGHLVGDENLRSIATRLSAAARRRNGVARLGGDEFAVLLEGLPASEAAAEVERIRSQASGLASGAAGRITLSAGWAALVAPSTKPAIDQALHQADAALRVAKLAGRERTCP